MSNAINLTDIVKDLEEVRTRTQKLKSANALGFKEEFIEDLKETEKGQGKIFSTKEELKKYLEGF